MKLKQIALRNFRKFDEIYVNPSDETELSGNNGCGKTTFKEAVLFGLYGRDNTGSNISNEGLIKNGQVIAEVELEFEDFTLKRVKSAGASKAFIKEGDNKYEGVAQRDLDTTIPKHNLFASVFDVGYFHKLPEKEQRQIVLENTPAVDRKDLFSELYPGYEQLLTEFNVNLDEGYGTARKRVMTALKDVSNDIRMIGVPTPLVYIPEEIELVETELKHLEEVMLKLPDSQCKECGQPLPQVTEVKTKISVEQARLQQMLATNKKIEEDSKLAKKEKEELQDIAGNLQWLADKLAPKQMPAVEFGIKIKPIVKFLNTILPGIEIETTRVLKTTMEWEECFVIKYNGVDYERLSTGETKKVSLAFSEMLDKLTNYKVGIKFVDHMECITGKLPQVGGQLILARVAESGLNVTTKETK